MNVHIYCIVYSEYSVSSEYIEYSVYSESAMIFDQVSLLLFSLTLCSNLLRKIF